MIILLSTSENILLFVSGFGMLQGILSAALLYFHPRSDRSVNSFLALYILSLTLPIILPLAQHIFSWQVVTFIEPFLMLIGPLLYLYVCSFKEVITWKKAWPHFIFFILSIPLAWWVYVSVGSQYPATERIPPEATRQLLLIVPLTIRILQRLAYYFLSRRALGFYQRSIVQLFSDTSRINLNWTRWLINGSLFLILLSIVVYALLLNVPQYFNWWILIAGVVVSLYLFMAAYKGIAQITLWQIHSNIDKEKLEKEINNAGQLSIPEPAASDNGKDSIADPKINDIAGRILVAMEQEKLYQEPELTLQHLADKLQLPSYQVSKAIKDGIKKNFYDLINGYRVEEAKRLLLIPQSKNYTILSVGFEAGFNSKTTFNTVFKKFTGLTPTDFRDKQKVAAF